MDPELLSVVEALDKVPEAMRGFYAPMEGGAAGFKLKVKAAGGYELTNPGTLRTALEREREDHRKARERIGKWGERDPDTTLPLLAKIEGVSDLDALLAGRGKGAADIEAVKRELGTKHEGERATWTKREKALQGGIERHLRRATALQAIAAEQGNDALLMSPVLDRLRVKEAGEDFTVVVVDEQGTERITKAEGQTGPMSVREYVQELKRDARFQPAFKGSGAEGGGTPPGSGGGGAPPASGNVVYVTQTQAKDFGAYKAMREKAQKEGKRVEIVAG